METGCLAEENAQVLPPYTSTPEAVCLARTQRRAVAGRRPENGLDLGLVQLDVSGLEVHLERGGQ